MLDHVDSRQGSHSFQFSVAALMLAVTVVCVIFSLYIWLYRPYQEAIDLNRQIRASVDSLASKQPTSMTRQEWECATGWTVNLIANSGLWSEGDLEALRQFEKELRQKSQKDVDMDTILWIWDQVAQLTQAGNRYQHFRQDMLDQIASVSDGASALREDLGPEDYSPSD